MYVERTGPDLAGEEPSAAHHGDGRDDHKCGEERDEDTPRPATRSARSARLGSGRLVDAVVLFRRHHPRSEAQRGVKIARGYVSYASR